MSSAPASIDDVIATAVSELTLEAKVTLLTGADTFSLAGEPSIGLRPLVFSDGPTGVRGSEFTGGARVGMFPNATLLAQSWDDTAAQRVGELLAGEGRRQNVDVVLGPTINLHRSALGGRLFEAFSEDPLLSGRLAAAYVNGIQRYGVGACLKHYVANESETDRHTMNAQVSPAALRELYLMPFEICLADAHPWSVMAAYNKINGTEATEHEELNNGVLKGEWDWDGLLMSDWGATKTAAEAARGGLDLVMPGPRGPWGAALVDAVRAGEVEESAIDDHLARLLRLAGRVGALHAIAPDRRAALGAVVEPTDPVFRLALRTLASSGMVLLSGQDVLPLAADEATEDDPLLLIGRHAVATVLQGGGSAAVRPPHAVTVADGLVEALGPVRVRVVDGVNVRVDPPAAATEVITDPRTGAPGARVTRYDTTGAVQVSTVNEVPEIVVWPAHDPATATAEVEVSARIDLPAGTPIMIGVRGVGEWRLTYGDLDHEVTIPSPPAEEAGFMIPPTWVTVVDALEDAVLTVRSRLTARISLAGLIAQPAGRSDDEALADAVRAATGARTAVVVVGVTAEQETEAIDKATLALPGRQDELVTAVAAVARRTVVVVNAATPVLMPWRNQVDAILVVGLPGQEGGHAVSDVLLGRSEPTGRLVTTFPARDGEGPAWSVTPIAGTLDYAEGTAMGYRGWDRSAVEPAFWLGAGLGWGTWDYRAAEHRRDRDGAESVTVTLANTGIRPSTEVVQVYWRPENGAPVRLVGYAVADTVVSGEQRVVTVGLDPRVLRLWDHLGAAWTTPAGGRLVVARGLGDVRIELDRT